MFIEPADKTVSALAHGEDQFEADAKGRFDVPADVAAVITARPGWAVSEDQTDAEPAKAPAKKPAAKKTAAKAE
jgi:hypothetical protein